MTSEYSISKNQDGDIFYSRVIRAEGEADGVTLITYSFDTWSEKLLMEAYNDDFNERMDRVIQSLKDKGYE